MIISLAPYHLPQNLTGVDIGFSCFSGYLIQASNVSNLRFSDIIFKECTGGADEIYDSEGFEFINISYSAAWLERVNHSKIRNCYAHQ